jgi:hypothetical protein
MRESEYNMEITNGNEFSSSLLDPVFFEESLTLWAVAIAA